jgi:site-specific recombinase XerD
LSEYFDLRRRWLDWMRARSMSEATVKNYSTAVRNFIDAVELEPSEVREEHILAYVGGFGGQGASKNVAIQGLKSFFGWCSDRGIVAANPAADLKAKKKKYADPRYLTVEQIASVLSEAGKVDERRALCLKLLYMTGIRVGSASYIRPGDIDLETGVLHIRIAKGSKPYDTPITVKLRPVLVRLLELWPNPTGYAEQQQYLLGVKDRTIWYWCKEAGNAAGIVGVHPHLLRHSYATHLLHAGANLEVVRRLMNHESLAVTQQYLGMSDDLLREGADLL